MKKYQFKDKNGEIVDIFRGKGFTDEYLERKNLPILNHKNEWDSGDIRLKGLGINFKNNELQMFMKQQRLEYLFGIKFKKPDLIDGDYVVAFYEYKNFKNIYNYGIIRLSEFIKRNRDSLAMPLVMEDINVDELLETALKAEEELEENRRQQQLLKKRYTKILSKVNEKRENRVMYVIQEVTEGYRVERFTAASEKSKRVKTKEEVKNFIESNKRGDNRNGMEILYYDSELKKRKW